MLLRKKALFFGKIRAQEIRNSLLTKISLRNMLLCKNNRTYASHKSFPSWEGQGVGVRHGGFE